MTLDPLIIFSTLCDAIGILRWIIPLSHSDKSIKPVLNKFITDRRNDKRNERRNKILIKSINNNDKCIDYLIFILAADETNEQSKQLIYKLLQDKTLTQKNNLVIRAIQILQEERGRISIQIECLNVLGILQGEVAITTLISYVLGYEWQLSKAAIENLGNIKSDLALPVLSLIPLDSDQEVLRTSADALSSTGSRKSLPRLYNLLNHEMLPIRETAATAIGNLRENSGDPEALNNLKSRIYSENEPDVVNAIGDAMKRINTKKGKECLETAEEYLRQNDKKILACVINSHYYTLIRSRGMI